MRGILIASAALGGWLAACPAARAGLYLSTEKLPPLSPDNIKFWVGQLRGIAIDRKGPPREGDLRPAYLAEAERLEALRREGPLSPTESADLGARYVRLGQPGKAITVLRAADQRYLLVRANLATAYFAQGELRMALRYQQRLLADWPSVWAGWTTQQLVWNRRSENYFLKLIEARLKEEVRGGARAAGFGGNEVPLDPLLPGLKFVGPSGRYEAGALAPRMWDRLPPGALDAVQQLVLWMPGDFRLYWLLAELLNVHGDVGPAYDILVELREGPGANFQGLHEHRKVLGEAVKFYHAWRPPPEDPYPAKTRGLLLSSFCAPALLVPGPAGAVAHQTASAAAYRCALVPRQEPSEPPAETAPADTPARARPFDWWHLVIAFAAGALVSALFALQWLEWRRRRPAPFAPPTPPDRGAGPPPERRAGSGITRGRPR